VVDLEYILGEEAEEEHSANQLGMGRGVPRKELLQRAQRLQEELAEAKKQTAKASKRARIATIAIREAHLAWDAARGEVECDLEAIVICVKNGAAEAGGAAIEAALGSMRAHLESERGHARECRLRAEAAVEVPSDDAKGP